MKTGDTLWLVGQYREDSEHKWEFQGVFDSEEKAIAACRYSWYFIAPARLNEQVPHETVMTGWPGACYPLVDYARDRREGERA